MKYENKLIITDIDGTFTDSNGMLVEKNLAAVEKFTADGGMFAIATGRIPTIMGKLTGIVEKLTNVPSIFCNGAFAYDYREARSFNDIFLNCEKAYEFVRLVERDFPQIAIRLFNREGKSVVHTSPALLGEGGAIRVCDIDELPKVDWYRISFDGDPESISELRKTHEPKFAEYFDFVEACPTIYEFNDKSATKGTALERLRRLLIDQGRADESLTVYAVGDFLNDLSMLSTCDIPCCPANAHPEVKKICKLELCHCDDGAIAELISRL